MKVSCDVIKDLLPLYAEDMISSDSKNLVNEHICDCEGCKGELESICEVARVPVDADARSLARLEKQMRKRKRWTAVTAVVLAITLLLSFGVFMMMPYWLTADEAIEYVEQIENGNIKVKTTNLSSGIISAYTSYGKKSAKWIVFEGRRINFFDTEVPEGMNEATREGYTLLYGYHVYRDYFEETRVLDERAGKENVYYLDYMDGTAEKVLWDAGEEILDRQMLTSNPWFTSATWNLRYVFYGAVGLFVLLALSAFLLRKHTAGHYLRWFAILAGSLAAATLLVTNGRFLVIDKEDLPEKLYWISAMTVMYFASVQCMLKIRSLKK